MSKRIFLSIYIIAAFLLIQYGQDFLSQWSIIPNPLIGWPAHFIKYLIKYLLLPALFVTVLHGLRLSIKELGLEQSFFHGGLIGLICVAPMLIGGYILNDFRIEIDPQQILFSAILAGLCEEVLYRGFLFGQLFRHAGWHFVPAGLLSALIFGSMHLYQGETIQEAAGVFMVTLSGGIWFSWLYIRWNYNLWIPIALHFLMNLSWMLFSLGDTALGGLWPNLLRILTIGLSIAITLRYTKSKGFYHPKTQEA